MTLLSVNLNAVAQLRNRRDLPWPSVVGLARVVLDAGASGVTVHPRPDERHIRRSDVFDLAELLATEYPAAEFNIEGYPSEDFFALIDPIKRFDWARCRVWCMAGAEPFRVPCNDPAFRQSQCRGAIAQSSQSALAQCHGHCPHRP